MSKISALMDVGKRSLSNSQTALQTVSHNIANKSTEGYSRQRVELMTNQPIGEGNLRIGMGAKAGLVTRTNNPWLEKQIQKETMNMGYMDSRADAMARVEQVYNEQLNKGLNQYVTEFFNSFRELSNNPESLTSRTIVRESATALTKDFGRVNSQLRAIQDDLDGQIKTNIDEINQLTREIAKQNEKVQSVEIQGISANDERDRRDLLLKKLSEKIDISYAEGKDGLVTVTSGRTAVLVSGVEATQLSAKHTDERDRVEVFYRATDNGSFFNITQQITGGKVGAALNVRDEVIENQIKSMDNLAFAIANEVNALHVNGFDRYGKAGDLFFTGVDGPQNASETIKLNTAIADDIGKIAAGAHPNAPGDNTVANMVSTLQFQKVMSQGGATFDDYYNAEVGSIGAVAQRAMKGQESQKNIIAQLSNIRESISGVSMDEEAAKMIEMQKAYDASARLIRTADEMFDTVLSLKRL